MTHNLMINQSSTVYSCKNPGTIANTVQRATSESIMSGNNFEYKCISRSELISGSLSRTCLMDETLSGTPPVCMSVFNDTIRKYQYVYQTKVIVHSTFLLTVYINNVNIMIWCFYYHKQRSPSCAIEFESYSNIMI